jgi:hypothetical protein
MPCPIEIKSQGLLIVACKLSQLWNPSENYEKNENKARIKEIHFIQS